ncbi:metal ABC transporter substrate-binding protein [Alcaligenaceae bacterium CGII-47]|nr:metal ABC transporter substrate-binding protein [Alcaligenaceae bacterium CGII-47]
MIEKVLLQFWRHGRFALVLFVACAGSVWAQADHALGVPSTSPVRVVATFSILADMVREVGGEQITLTTIVGRNGDAHTFEPTPRDARALAHAQMLVRNGLGFEGWLPRLVQASGFDGLDVVAATGVQALRLGEDTAHHDGNLDPHAWQDLSNGVVYVRNIAHGLAEVDPGHAQQYWQRAQAYIARLQAEDRAVRDRLAKIPAAQRVMMTSHEAFGYFGHAYGIRLISIVGISSEAEPTARTIASLIDQIRTEHIHALFLENAANPKLMQRIAQETGVRMGGMLYADALDAPEREAGTYLGMFRWNMQQLLATFSP